MSVKGISTAVNVNGRASPTQKIQLYRIIMDNIKDETSGFGIRKYLHIRYPGTMKPEAMPVKNKNEFILEFISFYIFLVTKNICD